MKTFQIQSIRLSSNLAFSVLKSRKVFFAILWQRNARRPRDSGPCRSEARLQSWDLVWALPLPCRPCTSLPLLLYTLPLLLQDRQKSAPAFRPCKILGSVPACPAKVCPCICRPCKKLPLHSGPCKILGSAFAGPAIV